MFRDRVTMKPAGTPKSEGDIAMSASSEEKWIDRWWPLLLILFGVLFVTVLVSFAPTI